MCEYFLFVRVLRNKLCHHVMQSKPNKICQLLCRHNANFFGARVWDLPQSFLLTLCRAVLLKSPRWSGNSSLTVRAKYDYTPQNTDELAFRCAHVFYARCVPAYNHGAALLYDEKHARCSAGDVIDVRGESDDHWYWGYLASKRGLVPANFVEVTKPCCLT